MKMRRNNRPTEKLASRENEAHGKPKTKKSQSDKKVTIVATLDNDTMVESFMFLNYCQLAKKSLVSKKYRDLIQKYRHKLALFYVKNIGMSELNRYPAGIKIFNEVLSPEVYNEWLIRNNYSKQAPLEDQIAGVQSTQYEREFYYLCAFAYYKDSNSPYETKSVFLAHAEINHENWPVFQHFVRLLTDPFIYIRSLELTAQNDVFNLLPGAMNSDYNRLKCKRSIVNVRDNTHKCITWIKDHVQCNDFRIYNNSNSNFDEVFLDFFLTGANCTSDINVENYDLCKVVVLFVQKFMDLMSCDENQLVESIRGNVTNRSVEGMKRSYSEFIVKEEHTYDCANYVFEFINNAIGKKLQLTAKYFWDDDEEEFYKAPNSTAFSLKLNNL